MAQLGRLSQAPYHFVISTLDNADDALETIRRRTPDVVLLDLHFPGDERRTETTGARLLREISAAYPKLPIVVFTTTLTDERFTPEELPGAAFRYAKDLIERRRNAQLDPLQDLAAKLRQAMASVKSIDPEGLAWPSMALGNSPEALSLRSALRLVAQGNDPVLVAGEPGSGLSDLGHAVHALSGRPGLRVFNCRTPASWAAFVAPPNEPTTLLVIGIDALTREAQAEWARVLEARTFRTGTWVMTTERDLLRLAQRDEFLADLAYGLEQYRLLVPALRERPNDIEAMARYWLEHEAMRVKPDFLTTLRSDVVERLATHQWPGNIAELHAVLARAVQFARSNVLLPAELQFAQGAPPVGQATPQPATLATSAEAYSDEESAKRLAKSIIAADPARRYTMLVTKDKVLRRLTAEELCRYLQQVPDKRLSWKGLAAFLGHPSDVALRKMLTTDGLRLRLLRPHNLDTTK